MFHKQDSAVVQVGWTEYVSPPLASRVRTQVDGRTTLEYSMDNGRGKQTFMDIGHVRPTTAFPAWQSQVCPGMHRSANATQPRHRRFVSLPCPVENEGVLRRQGFGP